MLDLEITPEKSISSEKWQIILGKKKKIKILLGGVWIFCIFFLKIKKGMSLYQVIQILKSNCETIKTVQLIYNDKVKLF